MKNVAALERYIPGMTTKKLTWLILMAGALFLLSSEPSLAQSFDGVNTFLSKIVKTITGPIGISVSAIAVIAVGFSFMTGRMDWTNRIRRSKLC
jgi:type IV secretory pathway VirB2 component (pilin)